jgi:hypothetical protein
MKSKSVYKIPNGKLLKIILIYNEKTNTIKEININGDFFAYPEESIEIMEKELRNIALKRDILLDKIQSIINTNKIEFIGVDVKGLTEGIFRCLP